MKTIIIYCTKHGTTKKVAESVSEILGDAAIVALGRQRLDISSFDFVVLGTPVYAGLPMKIMQKFYEKNLSKLLDKKIALFVCGMEPDADKQMLELKSAFPEKLFEHACFVDFLGGRFLFDKMNFIERFIIKRVAKVEPKTNISKINDERIKNFALRIKQSR